MATKPKTQTDETPEPEVQDVVETPDSDEVQDAPEHDAEPQEAVVVEPGGATHLNPQGHPVTLSPALHAYHEARGYTRIPVEPVEADGPPAD